MLPPGWQGQVTPTWPNAEEESEWPVRRHSVHPSSSLVPEASHALLTIWLLLNVDGDFKKKYPDAIAIYLFSTKFLLPSVLENKSRIFQEFSLSPLVFPPSAYSSANLKSLTVSPTL